MSKVNNVMYDECNSSKYNLVDKKGNVLKTFPSKNQAEKYKKKLKDSGYVGILMVVEVK